MKYWLWNWVYFPARHPLQFLCDKGIRRCGCPTGNRNHWTAKRRARNLRSWGWGGWTPGELQELMGRG